jgi:hypothetical protein
MSPFAGVRLLFIAAQCCWRCQERLLGQDIDLQRRNAAERDLQLNVDRH